MAVKIIYKTETHNINCTNCIFPYKVQMLMSTAKNPCTTDYVCSGKNFHGIYKLVFTIYWPYLVNVCCICGGSQKWRCFIPVFRRGGYEPADIPHSNPRSIWKTFWIMVKPVFPVNCRWRLSIATSVHSKSLLIHLLLTKTLKGSWGERFCM